MRRVLLSLSCLILGMVSSQAGPVSRSQAEALAKEFKNKRCSIPASLKCLPARKSARQTVTDNEKLYIFNIGNNEGFVVISGDDNAIPVLGYADHGTFNPDDIPANMEEWIRLNEMYIDRCAEKGDGTSEAAQSQGNVVVAPLLGDINWGQDYPFNELCPTYTAGGSTKHYYVGCVATAATQIMKYYNYPQRGTGSKSYTFDGQQLTADFANTTYDWDNMLTFYPTTGVSASQANAAATLAAHFGIAVEMEYAQAGSGALPMLVPGALRDYFGYDKATVMRKRDYYGSNEWLEIIKNELNAGRPVYYGATSDNLQGGHAFVCDGYDSNGYVHINWGWYGKSNGFFLINHLNPSDLGEGGGSGGYNTDQEIVTGIQPETGNSTEPCRPMYSSTRLSCTDYGTDFTLITIISNYETYPFDGEIGAALISGGNIIKILKKENMHVDGFANKKSGINFFTMRDIKTNAGTEVTDGKYEIRMVFRENDGAAWQILRHPQGYAGWISADVTDGIIKIDTETKPHPDATVLTAVKPDGEIYAKGSAIFNMRIRNNSSEFNTGNIVMRFTPVNNPEQKWDYANAVRIYNESTEDVSLLIKLDDDMPEGEYNLTLFENGYEEYTFDTAGDETVPCVTVLPAAAVPVMRMTGDAVWRNREDTDIRQGDFVYIVLGTRNYGAPGKVGIVTYLTDINNPENSYIFQQQNMQVDKGEAVTAQFSRIKLPVDPGTYRVTVKYITEDGQTTVDEQSLNSTETMVVGENTTDIMLEAVSFDFPDIIYPGETATGSITLNAPERFSGTLYVRARQHTITNGELIYMGTQAIEAGDNKTVNFTYKNPSLVPGEYIILVEAKQGGKEGTIGGYRNYYKIFTVKERQTDITNITADSQKTVSAVYKNGYINIISGENLRINNVEVFNLNGTRALVTDNIQDNCVPATGLANGIYVIRIDTGQGVYTAKFVK